MPGLQRLDQVAASSNKRRQFDVLLTVTAPHERLVLIATALLIVALALWATFWRVEREMVIEGALITPGERHEVVAAEPGHLIEYFVFPGDRVMAGERVAQQSLPELDREVEELWHRLDAIGGGAAQASPSGPLSSSVLDEMRTALQLMEARRAVRGTIVTHVAGEVIELRSAPGDFVAAGASVARIRASAGVETGQVHAVLRVGPHIAQSITEGMQATVEVSVPGVGIQRLKGEVVSVVAGPLPDWLSAMPPQATLDNLHRIDVLLRQIPDGRVPDGSACRVRLVLGLASPVALLTSNLF